MDLAEVMEKLEAGILRDGRYPPAAFEFLHRGILATADRVYGPVGATQTRDVSGRQICEGLRDLALAQWGPLARLVLSRWNIRGTRDFGEMVFLLGDLGVLRLQRSDQITDFDHVYDFRDAFTHYAISTDAIIDERVDADQMCLTDLQ